MLGDSKTLHSVPQPVQITLQMTMKSEHGDTINMLTPITIIHLEISRDLAMSIRSEYRLPSQLPLDRDHLYQTHILSPLAIRITSSLALQ